jgi:hypothetical protein
MQWLLAILVVAVWMWSVPSVAFIFRHFRSGSPSPATAIRSVQFSTYPQWQIRVHSQPTNTPHRSRVSMHAVDDCTVEDGESKSPEDRPMTSVDSVVRSWSPKDPRNQQQLREVKRRTKRSPSFPSISSSASAAAELSVTTSPLSTSAAPTSLFSRGRVVVTGTGKRTYLRSSLLGEEQVAQREDERILKETVIDSMEVGEFIEGFPSRIAKSGIFLEILSSPSRPGPLPRGIEVLLPRRSLDHDQFATLSHLKGQRASGDKVQAQIVDIDLAKHQLLAHLTSIVRFDDLLKRFPASSINKTALFNATITRHSFAGIYANIPEHNVEGFAPMTNLYGFSPEKLVEMFP